LTKFIAFCTLALTLCSCSSYQKYQTKADQQIPYDCTGLHIEHASWYFIDEFNQPVTVTGRCSRGMKHGYFQFFIDGIQVARTKFTRNQEVETLCYALDNRHTDNLKTCIIANAKKRKGVKKTVPEEKQSPAPRSTWDESPWN